MNLQTGADFPLKAVANIVTRPTLPVVHDPVNTILARYLMWTLIRVINTEHKFLL